MGSPEWRMPVLLKPEEYDLSPWRYSGRSLFRRSIILVRWDRGIEGRALELLALQELNVWAGLLELAGDVVPASEREFFDIRGW